ncbi:hypothetical protein ECANGB1_898 [Enterospora canceri]|uniref:Ribosomal protein eL8/eL30/eS12/Gadd45 domain-containing protein n=1 Tax=Enterospora canceri TaxID=1081671 RepID=A0A1Y1S796_9MICR|nr:hypothetical protein ECANGB1_898 [Enterospora canceri]
MSDNGDELVNLTSSLKKCFQIAYNHVQAAPGATEVYKTLIRNEEMQLVVLSKDLPDKPREMIMAKCQSNNVPVVFIETRSELGKLCPTKVKNAGAFGIKNFMLETEEKAFLMSQLK